VKATSVSVRLRIFLFAFKIPNRGRPWISSTSSSETVRVSSFAAPPPAVVAGITGPWSRPGEPTGDEVPARGGVGTPLSSAGGVGALLSSSTTLLGGGVLAASSFLVGVLVVALAGAGCSSVLVAVVVAAGCSVVCGAASPTAATGSAALWPATWSGSTFDAALNNKTTIKQCQKQQQNVEYHSK